MNIKTILDDAYASAGREKARQDELVALREQNAALVAALEAVWQETHGLEGVRQDVFNQARAALSKCKGAKPAA